MKEAMEPSSTDQNIIQGKTGEQFLSELLARPEKKDAAEAWRTVLSVTQDVEKRGGAALLVGGSVRDELLGLDVKDFDLEIYHLPLKEIEEVVRPYGSVGQVGKAFNVLKLHAGQSDIDIAAPRRDSKTGRGHKGFSSEPDPAMSVAEAARRRDFTINALTKHPISGEIIDYYGGLDDIHHKILRAVDEKTFVEDPLRLLRAFQFAGRFNLTAEPKTESLLKKMMPEVRELPRERLYAEWSKLFLKSPRPSQGLELARQVGYFTEYFPEMEKLSETKQDPEYHPEGDVWTHTMLVVDQAGEVARRHRLSDEQRLPALLAAWLHDVGKSTATTEIDGRFPAYGHEEAGVKPATDFLVSQGFPADIIDQVIPLIEEHMRPHALYKDSQRHTISPGAFRRMLNRLHPATLDQLLVVTEADYRGRGPVEKSGDLQWSEAEYHIGPWLRDQIKDIAMSAGRPEPLIRGQDLLDRGWKPGPDFGRVLQAAEKLAESGWSKEKIWSVVAASSSAAEAVTNLTSADTSS